MLALFGGRKTRTRPFRQPVIVDKDDRKEILGVLRRKEFSRFMGSPSADIEPQLAMSSRDAARRTRGQYFTFLGGTMIRQFEADFARRFRTTFAISVNSATSGLIAAIGACGIGPGDEVITTCLSFNATAMSILAFNAIPVFADVAPANFCLDPYEIEKSLTPKTKAILVVHLLGNAADMDAIMKIARMKGLKVIEDCAQAPGVRSKGKYAGTIGDIGVFSFQETKNITTGEGGMIVTDDPLLARACRLIRNHGESIPDADAPLDELVNVVGFNFRMTELTAALGISQLKKLDVNNRIRNVNARFLAENLRGLPGITVPQALRKNGHVCHVFALLYDEAVTGVKRSAIIAALRAEGIPAGTGYLRLMPENPLFQKQIAYGKKGCPFSCPFYGTTISYDPGRYPVASELIYRKFIWIYHINRPNTLNDMRDIVRAFRKVFSQLTELKGYKDKRRSLVYKW